MINKSNQTKFLTLVALAVCFVLVNFQEVSGQTRDPFEKPKWEKPATAPKTVIGKDGKEIVVKPGPPPVVPVGAPDIQARINYYKTLRERAAVSGEPLPKVTSVLTLDEMSITGIFRTPRGYAAMIEAKPINLTYTVYPGEKFFNGQLVAVEENRVVFRKVVKMSNGKFITSEENKTLRQYTQQEEIQGTAPTDTSAKTETKPAETAPAPTTGQTADPNKPAQPTMVISPLDEMNRQPAETPKSAKDKTTNKKGKSSTSKKPAKVAGNQKQ
jgi:hypothetical protein